VTLSHHLGRIILRSIVFGSLIAFAVFVGLFSKASSQQPHDDEVERVSTDLVLVNVTVKDDKGKLISGLRQNEFKLTEDSKDQPISFFGAESTPFAAVILLDTSGSMEQRMSLARSAAGRFVEGLRPDDAVAVYQFDSEVTMLQDFSSSSDLTPKVFSTRARGMTVLYDAVVTAAQILSQRPERRKAILILSDGADTRSSASLDKALNSALAVDASIYGVDMTQDGTGDRTDTRVGKVLRYLSDKSGGVYVGSGGGPALRQAFKDILQELGGQYTIGYQPSNRNFDGKWREIKVQLARPGISVRARKGYRAQRAAKS
jgi:Ca-activated chloride channel family protein